MMAAEQTIRNANRISNMLGMMEKPRPELSIRLSQQAMDEVIAWLLNFQTYHNADTAPPMDELYIYGIPHIVDTNL